MMQRVLAVCLTILFGYLLLRITVGFLTLNVGEFSGDWVAADQSYFATLKVVIGGDYCLCPTYQCETLFEAPTLAQKTLWGWREFTYFIDPADEDAFGRRIHAGTQAEFCLSKEAGDFLELSLVPVGMGLELRLQ